MLTPWLAGRTDPRWRQAKAVLWWSQVPGRALTLQSWVVQPDLSVNHRHETSGHLTQLVQHVQIRPQPMCKRKPMQHAAHMLLQVRVARIDCNATSTLQTTSFALFYAGIMEHRLLTATRMPCTNAASWSPRHRSNWLMLMSPASLMAATARCISPCGRAGLLRRLAHEHGADAVLPTCKAYATSVVTSRDSM